MTSPSEIADAASDMAQNVSTRLKAAGVDTDRMVDKAKEQASELGRLISEEVARRPWQALAIAAGIGFWYGLRLR